MDDMLRKGIKRKQELVRLILTDGTEISGKLHLLPEHRLLDLLNCGTPNSSFLAVTEACVEPSDGVGTQLPFLIVNANTIRLCFPISEKTQQPG